MCVEVCARVLHACASRCMYTHTHIYTHITFLIIDELCVCECVCVCVFACTCTCTCVCVCVCIGRQGDHNRIGLVAGHGNWYHWLIDTKYTKKGLPG